MPYHVRVFVRRSDEDIEALPFLAKQMYVYMADVDEAWIEEHIALPRREGHAILFSGRVIEWKDISSINIVYTDRTFKQLQLERVTAADIFHPTGYRRLQSAGCEIDQTGTRWLDPARFPNRDPHPGKPPSSI